jgi:hypothetical protein
MPRCRYCLMAEASVAILLGEGPQGPRATQGLPGFWLPMPPQAALHPWATYGLPNDLLPNPTPALPCRLPTGYSPATLRADR